MHKAVNNGWTRKGIAAAVLVAAASLGAAPRAASASGFSSFALAAKQETAPYVVDVSSDEAPAAATQAADVNELRLQNNAHPTATAPLPPALITGSGLLIGNWVARRMFKRRWI